MTKYTKESCLKELEIPQIRNYMRVFIGAYDRVSDFMSDTEKVLPSLFKDGEVDIIYGTGNARRSEDILLSSHFNNIQDNFKFDVTENSLNIKLNRRRM